VDGVSAEPATLNNAVPNWGAGDTIHLGKRTLRVIGKRGDDADQPPVRSLRTRPDEPLASLPGVARFVKDRVAFPAPRAFGSPPGSRSFAVALLEMLADADVRPPPLPVRARVRE
jgi:hypothetical protein